jgi:hypothetical protein
MPRRTKRDDVERLHRELLDLVENYEAHLKSGELRERVIALIPVHYVLRDLGCSLMEGDGLDAAIDRIIGYLRTYPLAVIGGDELMIVSGVSEYARRVRQLRVEFGWSIVSGMAMRELKKDAKENDEDSLADIPDMKVDDYILLSPEPDRDAAYRWNVANKIRKKKTAVKSKILEFLRLNVGKVVTGDELRYVANNKTEWARRSRELRTQEGWPVSTKTNGRPDLPVGTYILEQDRQLPPHDRKIKDPVRRAVLKRDDYRCQMEGCGWEHSMWNRSDPRHLEAHHIQHHSKGGSNDADNLITYCNICHDEVHGREKSEGR